MGDKIPISRSEGGRVSDGGWFMKMAFVLNNLPFLKWEINYQMVKTNLPIDGIDGALEKEEGLSTRSEFFSLILLAAE